MTRDRLVGWWRFHSPRQLRRMLAIAVRAEAERDAARAEADDLRRQLLSETYRPEGGEIVMRELGKVKRERDAARAEAERLRERTHEIADEANRRYAPYVSRCAEFDNQIAAAREHFSRYAFPEPFSGVPRTWWEMTSQYNRLALMEIIGQRDAAIAEASRVREALTAIRSPEAIERAAEALYEEGRPDTYTGEEWDWPNIDHAYDWDGDHDERGNPEGQSPEWLRDRYRAEARAALDAALDGGQPSSAWRRNPACVERWPDCADGEYNPACCRFPKACSCDEPIGERL